MCQLGDWEDIWDPFEKRVLHWQSLNRSEEDRFQHHHQQQWEHDMNDDIRKHSNNDLIDDIYSNTAHDNAN